ncbi:PLD-like domain protein [Leptospira hartskeerlii]|uniref:phospholipase D n=1 Tax=Leptospira hartskeerlii TaxID=2023177 RepID=A0A2M9XEP1_9LEPT|nr:phospholipase D-like domain-containing protein [Leptospira hartskeerlii]PJZ26147.1 PLD-like domain protein [Leptospira hartskeerlii]PJZ34231.1 PLD-like domain protein [Leptospira hartskeerlii]
MKKFYFFLFTIIYFYSCEKTEEDVSVFWEDELFPKVFFSYPGRFVPVGKKRNVRDEILRIVRGTKESIYMHIYSFDDPEIEGELLKANQRGVHLELMGEWGKTYPSSILPFLKYWEGTGLQHTKVLVSDKSLVFMGTGNFTFYGLEQDHNGYFEFKLNRKEWENFYSFLKEEYPFPVLKIAGLEFWNSPLEGNLIQNRLLDSVLSSRYSIRYLIFDHYDPVLSSGFTRTNHRSGEGIYNRPVDPEGEILSIIPGIEIMEDGNEDILDGPDIGKGGLLHHKTMILDDIEVLTGSYNYSLNARDSNREILIRLKDVRIAKEFKQEWENIRTKSKRVEVSSSKFQFNSVNAYIYDENNDQICRSQVQPEDSFLEIGFAWFHWTNFYRWKEESCKSIVDYESISSRSFGSISEFPKTEAENLGIRSFSRNGILEFSVPESDLMNEFHSTILKPSLFLRPSQFLGTVGAWVFSDTSELTELLAGNSPGQVWILERGKLPRKLGVSMEEGVYYLSETITSNSGVMILEYENFGLYFCYKSINYNLHWPEEILFAVYDFREAHNIPDQYSKSNLEFFAEQGLPNQRRENLCVISL